MMRLDIKKIMILALAMMTASFGGQGGYILRPDFQTIHTIKTENFEIDEQRHILTQTHRLFGLEFDKDTTWKCSKMIVSYANEKLHIDTLRPGNSEALKNDPDLSAFHDGLYLKSKNYEDSVRLLKLLEQKRFLSSEFCDAFISVM